MGWCGWVGGGGGSGGGGGGGFLVFSRTRESVPAATQGAPNYGGHPTSDPVPLGWGGVGWGGGGGGGGGFSLFFLVCVVSIAFPSGPSPLLELKRRLTTISRFKKQSITLVDNDLQVAQEQRDDRADHHD